MREQGRGAPAAVCCHACRAVFPLQRSPAALALPWALTRPRPPAAPPCSTYLMAYVNGTGHPSGEFEPVAGTIYDFSQPTPLGLHVDDPQLGEGPALVRGAWLPRGLLWRWRWAATVQPPASSRRPRPLCHPRYPLLPDALGGYDNVWALWGMGTDAVDLVRGFVAPGGVQLAATLVDPGSGRGLEIWSDAPAAIVYTANWLGGEGVAGKGGAVAYARRDGVAIEVAQFPNAINEPAFPPVVSWRSTPAWTSPVTSGSAQLSRTTASSSTWRSRLTPRMPCGAKSSGSAPTNRSPWP